MPTDFSFRAGALTALSPRLLGSRHVLLDPDRIVAPATFPRSASAHPIAPDTLVLDTMLLSSPDGATSYYIPRYRLRSAGDRYDIHVEPGPTGRFVLRLVLDAFPAPELGDAARTAVVLPGTLTAWLTYGSPILAEVVASATSEVEGGLAVEFSLTLAERDAVLWAFRSEQGARLTVTRAAPLAVPAGSAPVRLVPLEWVAEAAVPQLRMSILEPVEGPVVEPVEVPVIERVEPDPIPVLEPDPDPIIETFGADVAGSARLVVGSRLTGLMAVAADEPTAGFALAARGRLVGLDRAVVRDHRTGPIVRDHRTPRIPRIPRIPVDVPEPSPTVPEPPVVVPPAEQQYSSATPSLQCTVDLRFDPAVHPYVYPGTGSGGSAPSYERLLLEHDGRRHPYLREVAVPHVFYHLPDAFRLARTTTAPLRPALAFRVDQGAEESEASVTLTCQITPVTELSRLAAAAEALAANVPERDGVRPAVELRPLRASATLTLGLPEGTDDADAQGESVDVVNGFLFAESFPFAEFQDVYAALAAVGDVSTVLRGTVSVATGLAAEDLIPVDLRFATTVGDVLASAVTVDAEGTADVALRNASESPVRISSLTASVSRGTAVVAGEIAGLHLPVELAPDGEISCTVTPSAQLGGEGDIEVGFDTSGVEALPDPAAILALTLDRRIAQSVNREVTVLTTAAKLAADTARPVETVIVELDGGPAPVVVDAATPSAKGKVPVPLVDVLLGRDGGGEFRYRQTLVTASGETVEDADWRTTDRSLLVVPVT
ncbi:hypothetical protein Bcav_0355 [Beutenbergia cavernae DSM 12333]|uniref:Uncharacterized protein n=1 Tax=Beutenbergia cavernae (strain ATCC BAA-8 / DSM 12333 / CCUG 43141 / JCM 11478 / NBRC 16432 / NCIMB 13614 / HKI 0122) TaxID=471853 RepID=C5BWG1_BEUC1|nr:hypothetical protein [Beutenbergia cavernae]ACQ78619.1 hypothetical protein Bcav_0355 [Beutenbergia cavernae DSM 12333]